MMPHHVYQVNQLDPYYSYRQNKVRLCNCKVISFSELKSIFTSSPQHCLCLLDQHLILKNIDCPGSLFKGQIMLLSNTLCIDQKKESFLTMHSAKAIYKD